MIHFADGVPHYMQCLGGTLSTTAEQYKRGPESLRWVYRSEDKLRFTIPIGYVPVGINCEDQRRSVFSAYVFCGGQKGSLIVSFYKEGRLCCGFRVQLAFHGWRNIAAAFDRDMAGQPEFGMDEMRIEARGEDGYVLLDEIVPSALMDCRAVQASAQLPHLPNPSAPFVADWTLKKNYHLNRVREADLAHIQTVLETYVLTEFPCDAAQHDALLQQVDTLHLRDGAFGIAGKPIEFSGRPQLLPPHGTFADLREIGVLLRNMAVCLRNRSSKPLEQAYIRLLRFLMLQGFAAGSSMGTHRHLAYALAPLYHSVLLMQPVLRREQLLPQVLDAMRWFLHLGKRGFLERQPRDRVTADDFRDVTQGILIFILCLEKPHPMADWMVAYRAWLADNLTYTDGLRDGIKEDGCVLHSGGHDLRWAQGVLDGVAPVMRALDSTAFRLPDAAWQTVKRMVLAMHFQCAGQRIPRAFSTEKQLSAAPLRYVALSALERQEETVVNACLRLMQPPQMQPEPLASVFVDAETTPQGNRSFPFACANVHRRGQWTVITKGFSRYLYGTEITPNRHLYSRYRAYGTVELMHENSAYNACCMTDGYDPNRLPGATTVILPWERLRAQVRNVDTYGGFAERLLGSESFAGSVSLDGNGMFSMIVTGHPKYDASFRAYQSVFCLHDFVLLMGSNIANDSLFETETTLYQNEILPTDAPPHINGQLLCGERTVEQGDVLTDNRGHRYYLPAGTRIRLYNGEQTAPRDTDDGEGTGNFARAGILHGASPQNASYVYGIGIGGAAALPYRILRQDAAAHAVTFGEWCFIALFEAGETNAVSGVQSDTPILLLMRKTETGITLAVCDPDLGLYRNDPSQFDAAGVQQEVSIESRRWTQSHIPTKEVHLVLPGRYRAEEEGVAVDPIGESTRLTVRLKGGKSQTITLHNIDA